MSSTITPYLLADYTLELSSDYSELLAKENNGGSTVHFPTNPGLSVEVNDSASYVIKTATCEDCYTFEADPPSGGPFPVTIDGAKMIGVGVVRIEDTGVRTIEFYLDQCPVYLSHDGGTLKIGVTTEPDKSPDETCYKILS